MSSDEDNDEDDPDKRNVQERVDVEAAMERLTEISIST
jgi:hypothetical protein